MDKRYSKGDFFSRINKRRLWLLVSFVWVSSVFFFSTGAVIEGYERSNKSFYADLQSEKEKEFQVCLKSNGVNYLSLLMKNKEECNRRVEEECGGWWLCPEDFHYKVCIRSKAPEKCRNIFVASIPTFHDNVSFWLDRQFYYFSTGYSSPLKCGLFFLFLGPFLFAVGPIVCKKVWDWLLTKQE